MLSSALNVDSSCGQTMSEPLGYRGEGPHVEVGALLEVSKVGMGRQGGRGGGRDCGSHVA